MSPAPKRRRFGQLTKMRSGRWQARYTVPATHPSGKGGTLVTAPHTFQANTFGWEAGGEWLKAEEQRLIEEGVAWLPPEQRFEADRKAAEAAKLPTFEEYAGQYLRERKVRGRSLEPSTLRVYDSYLTLHVLPTFGPLILDEITPTMVNLWYDGLPDKAKTRRECYTLARSVMTAATSATGPLVGHINPFAIRGGGSNNSRKREQLVTSTELDVILKNIKPEWRSLILLAIWCGMRFGELAELRRSDIDLDKRVIRIRRAMSRAAKGAKYEKTPKSDAGHRDQRIPAAIAPALKEHLNSRVTGHDGLVFPGPRGGWLDSSVFYGRATETDDDGKVIVKGKPGTWYEARRIAGRDDLHLHDLRATGATLLAQNGASIAEVQAFLGDSTPAAAMRYVRAAQSRMDTLTEGLSNLAERGGW